MPSKVQNAKQINEVAHKREVTRSLVRQLSLQSPVIDPALLQRAIASPDRARPSDILTLQRTVGNQAVTRLIEAKLTTGPAHDRYEQEAGRVAPPQGQHRPTELVHTTPTATVQRRGGHKKKRGKKKGGGGQQRQPPSPQLPPSPSGQANQPHSIATRVFNTFLRGVSAFANSVKIELNEERIGEKLKTGLLNTIKLELSSESFKVEAGGIKIPLAALANAEFGLEFGAKLEDEDKTLLAKLQEGAELEELADVAGLKQLTNTGVKKLADNAPGLEKLTEKMPGLKKLADNPPGLAEVYGGTEFSRAKLLKEFYGNEGLKLTKSQGVKLAVEGKGSAKLAFGFGWLQNLAQKYIGGPLRDVEAFVKDYLLGTQESDQQGWGSWIMGGIGSGIGQVGSGINWLTGGRAGEWAKSAAGWARWAAQILPGWVVNSLPAVTKEGMTEWLQKRLEFIKKLDVNKSMPNLAIGIEGEGKSLGFGQVEDMKVDTLLDLSAPESFLGTWVKELQGAYLPDSNLAETIMGAITGKHRLFSVKGITISVAKGVRGVLSSIKHAFTAGFELGPALGTLWGLIAGIANFAKRAWQWLVR
jgi:hypothetical protein